MLRERERVLLDKVGNWEPKSPRQDPLREEKVFV